MKKSIYYLIANSLSLVIAWITMGAMQGMCPININFATMTVNNVVSWWGPLVLVVAIEALSIIHVTIDCTRDTSNSLLSKILNVVLGILTVGGIYITWLALILESHNYNLGSQLSFPLIYTILFVVSLIGILLTPVFNKKNGTFAISLIFVSLLVFVAGVAYDCVSELYVILPIIGVALLVLIISLFVSFRSKKA